MLIRFKFKKNFENSLDYHSYFGTFLEKSKESPSSIEKQKWELSLVGFEMNQSVYFKDIKTISILP